MSLISPSSNSSSNPLLADALQRAQALAGHKRPSEESLEEPDHKRPQFEMMQGDGMEMNPSWQAGPPAGMPGGGMSTEQVMVPDNMVGLIIGRGGEQITRLQAESGCKIQMSQDSQGLPHRLCTLTGSAEAIGLARSMIDGIIANEGNRGGRVGGGGGGMGGGGGGFEMMVPGHLVARIIGKGGETIKALQEETGAKIVIIQDSKEFADEKPLKITGPPDKVEHAKVRVEQVIAEEQEKMGGGFRGGRGGGRGGPGGFRGGGRGGPPNGAPRGGRGGGWPNGGGRGGGGFDNGGAGGGGYGDVTEMMTVPSNKVGLVMGKGGETIRSICSSSGAHCQVDKAAPEGAREKNIVIKGNREAVDRALAMIQEKIGGAGYQSAGGGGGGHRGYGDNYGSPDHGYGGGHGGPPQGGAGPLPGGPGQPDYSPQWAEYYRSLGMVKEAEIIEQQSAARQPQAVAAAPASDYSAQWAEYYRSIGKLKEAEAIEAQMRVKSASVPPAGAPSYGAPAHYQGHAPYQGGQPQGYQPY